MNEKWMTNKHILNIKEHLVFEIVKIIKKNCNQCEYTKILGINQEKISQLINSKLQVFSLEKLIEFLILLECNIFILIKPKNEK